MALKDTQGSATSSIR